MPSSDEQTILTGTKPIAAALRDVAAQLKTANDLTMGPLLLTRLAMGRKLEELEERNVSSLIIAGGPAAIDKLRRDIADHDAAYPMVAARAIDILCNETTPLPF